MYVTLTKLQLLTKNYENNKINYEIIEIKIRNNQCLIININSIFTGI